MLDHMYYPKIANRPPSDMTYHSAQWVATEKIHGAQFVVGVNEREVKYGKRKAWLQDDEPFFGWQIVRNLLDTSARKLFSTFSGISALYLYGELFGGGYPHDDVKNSTLLAPVQTGIWYSPDIRYAVFDMLIVRDENPIFLSFSDVESLVATTQLLTVPVLGYGAYDTLKMLPVRYDSKVHAQLGLPGIKNNYAEGFVLKPACEMAGHNRPVVKHKIPEFSENRFGESQPFNSQSMPSVEELSEMTSMMINRMRIESARSKVGEQHDAIVEESVLDVLVDLESIFPLKMSLLPEHEEQQLVAIVKKHVEDCLEKYKQS